RGHALRYRDRFYDPSDAARRQCTTAQVEQQRRSLLFRALQDLVPLFQVERERFARILAEGNVALFLSLSADENGFVRPRDIVETDPDQFRVADAAAVEQLEDHTVAFREGGLRGHRAIESGVHLFNGGHAGKDFGELWSR